MYTPRLFEEQRLDVMHALIAANPLGALVRHGPDGLVADHIPFDIGASAEGAPFGILRAHVARNNPIWREAGTDVMVLFQSPTAYVSPGFYAEKPLTGKVVPTWNYAVVHAFGKLEVVDDAAWLLSLVERLTNRHEAGRAQPWKVDDAPRQYADAMLKAIVGIEIRVDRMDGKWKISQDDGAVNQARIADGLAAEGCQLGTLMQALLAPQQPPADTGASRATE
jgi:transcriptional regulator